ncbi:MAG: hypothetical protein GX478_01615 [Erysipelotrichaceae bacterium]|nr:hypothetical protein [Erysipelotrichaceae bacterium]
MMTETMKIYITWGVFYLVWYILNALGYKGEFKKAGVSEGKAFIPFVREMEVYKLCWNKKNIGVYWLLTAVLGIVMLIAGSMLKIQVIAWAGFVLVIASQVLQIMRCFHQSKAFGRTGGMTAALVLVNPIANFILGRSLSEYKGIVKA